MKQYKNSMKDYAPYKKNIINRFYIVLQLLRREAMLHIFKNNIGTF